MLTGKASRSMSILAYTRVAQEGIYASHLALSMHLAYSYDGIHFEPLNQNYGILFAAATCGQRNTLQEKGLKSPFLFRTADGKFAVIAVRVNADGGEDEQCRGSILLWVSEDLYSFGEARLVPLKQDVLVQEAVCCYDAQSFQYRIDWRDIHGNCYSNTLESLADLEGISDADIGTDFTYAVQDVCLEGAIIGNVLEVEGDFGDRLVQRWTPLKNVSVRVPGQILTALPEDLNAVQAVAVYSDGSTARKKVNWNTQSVDFSRPGRYIATGTVVQDEYPFPLTSGFADPDILFWNGRYYFIATNDSLNDIGLYVRESQTVQGLFAEGVEQCLILGVDENKGFVQSFWAPEFHEIGGELWLLFAVSGKQWSPQCYMMKLKKGGAIQNPADWEEPVRVCRGDGAFLAKDGISLDMTFFRAKERCYLVWSYRQNIMTPYDTGSMLMIASTDPAEPWRLSGEPVLLSRPLLGWENNEHTINNEGPYAIVTDNRIFLSYSGGAAGGYTYAVGMLTADLDADLLEPSSWSKRCTPLLSYYSIAGEYGPGHNSFFTDAEGNAWIVYHAQDSRESHLRCVGIRRVHFNHLGEPVLNLSAQRDLHPNLTQVQLNVLVEVMRK